MKFEAILRRILLFTGVKLELHNSIISYADISALAILGNHGRTGIVKLHEGLLGSTVRSGIAIFPTRTTDQYRETGNNQNQSGSIDLALIRIHVDFRVESRLLSAGNARHRQRASLTKR